MRRVVITGLGMVTPLGCGVEHNWAAIKAGKSGIRRIESIPVDDIACQIAGVIPRGDGTGGTFNPDHAMDPKDQRKVDDFIIFALEAARQAVEDSGWRPTDYDDQVRSGVLVGSGIGGINGIVEAGYTLRDKGPRRVSPFFIPGRLINLTAGYISIAHGYKGPNSSVVTACSTGSHAIGDAARLIANDEADVMIAGGAESPICRLSLAGFASMKALCFAFNDRPEQGSRPYDRDRDGFVMGEGAGVVVVEELEHAKKRGATIYGEIVGYGMSGDAYHITAPSEDGDGAYRCMKAALRHAKISPEEIGYVNAHGTSTMADGIEVGAVERVFGDAAKNLAMSSTKSMTGHLLGAAGAIEAIYTTLAVRDSILPPTINLDNPNVETPIDLVPHKAKEKKLRYALSNSFGFGGTNASLIVKAFEG